MPARANLKTVTAEPQSPELVDSKAGFGYVGRELHCGPIPLSRIAQELGTPAYVYSLANLRGTALSLKRAAEEIGGRHLICYSVKANGNLSLLRKLAGFGLGADIVSGGELYLAQAAGFRPENIVFSGVGKRQNEIEEALAAGILALHVESLGELELIAQCARSHGLSAPVAVRVNPDIHVDTHAHVATGEKTHKFGVAAEIALSMMRAAAENAWLNPIGLSTHLGSQILSLDPFRQAASKLVELADVLRGDGLQLDYVDLGGGLAIDYDSTQGPDIDPWLKSLAKPIIGRGYRLLVEPGRSIVGPAGILLTQVLYVKEQSGRRIVVTDAGMTELMRPALYGAQHPIVPVVRPAAVDSPEVPAVEVVGPVCETADILASNCSLPEPAAGDLLAVLKTGAYGYSMSSNYNGRLRPAEVLVEGEGFRCIRERENYAALRSGCPDE